MKVLITSGGTKVKIDKVRSISNMSRGTFGTKIASEFASHPSSCATENDIRFLMAKDSKYPTNQYVLKIEYETFDDYERELFNQLEKIKPDILILAAAVSDYGVANYVDGKIRSKDDLVIRLKPLPKLISQVREKLPEAIICGFKLLVNSTDEELSQACMDSLVKNRLDLVVGNDWRDIENKNHKLMIYKNVNGVISFSKHDDKNENLADVVRLYCTTLYEGKKK